MGFDSSGDLSGGEVDKVEAVISLSLTRGEGRFCNLEIGSTFPEERRISEKWVVDSTRGVARGSELWDEDSGEMKVKDSDEDGGVAREDEIFQLELRQMHLLSDLEKGLVDYESGIFPLEMVKKCLLPSDLECRCVPGEVVSPRVLENEDASEATLVLGESCGADGMKKVARELRESNSWKTKGGDGRDQGFDLRRSLKIEVIDDTAVVEQAPICWFRGMVKEIGIPTYQKTQKDVMGGEKEADKKKPQGARRKAKSFRWSDEMFRKKENASARSQKRESGRKLMYSIKEMEALRFVNVIEQRRFWRRVYDGLGPVAKEYVSLLSCCNDSNRHVQLGLNFGCMRRSRWRERAPAVLGATTAGCGRGNHGLNIFVPPNMMKTLYAENWSYSYAS